MTEKTLLLMLGFVFTTVLGGLWGFLLKRRSWREETEHAIHRARFDEGTAFLDELSELVGRRFFLLQRLLWAIETGTKVQEREVEYFIAVYEWNAKFWRNRNKIRLLVSEDQAMRFLDYSDDRAGNHPNSLHYTFVVAHRKVIGAKANPKMLAEAHTHVVKLNWKCSVFLERLASEFLHRATSLQLLQIPGTPGGAEKAAAADAARRHG